MGNKCNGGAATDTNIMTTAVYTDLRATTRYMYNALLDNRLKGGGCDREYFNNAVCKLYNLALYLLEHGQLCGMGHIHSFNCALNDVCPGWRDGPLSEIYARQPLNMYLLGICDGIHRFRLVQANIEVKAAVEVGV